MVPLVLFTIDIEPLDQSLDEKELLVSLDPCLNRLRALKGSFDRRTDIVFAVHRHEQEDGRVGLTVRVVLAISVGMERAQHLLDVFDAYVALLRYELPNCLVKGCQEILKFR